MHYEQKGVSEASVYKIRTWVHMLFDLIVELLLPSVHPLDDYYQHLVVLFTSFSALQKMNGLHFCYDFLLKKRMSKKRFQIQRVPTLRSFWDFEKTVLHEIRVSGTLLWSPTNANSPTYTKTTNTVSSTMVFGLCTCKWVFFALEGDLLQSH